MIQFAGLNAGGHEYQFKVGDSFFEGLEFSEIRQADLTVDLHLLKQSTMMILEFSITGTVRCECDRCTESFDLPLQGNYRLIVKTAGQVSGEEDDDIIAVDPGEHELDLAQYIYEYIALSLPIRRIHPDDANGQSGCNPETLERLKDHVVNRDDDEPGTDPRWDGLKNIRLN